MNIEYSEVTFVIQGAISMHNGENITLLSVNRIREYYPTSKIIVSTWALDQKIESLVDDYIISIDPGPINSKNKYFINYNRMILSTVAGLDVVKTKYSVKLRSDFWFSKRVDFINFYQKKIKDNNCKSKYLNSHILMCMYKGHYDLFPYFISDWFHFGQNSDLIQLWSGAEYIKECSEVSIGTQSKFENKAFQHCDAVDNMDAPFHSEQLLCINLLDKFAIKTIPNFKLATFTFLYESYKILSEFFICIPRYQLGLISHKHETNSHKIDTFVWDLALKSRVLKINNYFLKIYLYYRYLRVQVSFIKRYLKQITIKI